MHRRRPSASASRSAPPRVERGSTPSCPIFIAEQLPASAELLGLPGQAALAARRRATSSTSSSSAPTTQLSVGLRRHRSGGPFREFDSHTYYHRGLVRWQHRFAGGAHAHGDAVGRLRRALRAQRRRRQRAPTQRRRRTFDYGLRAVYRLPLARLLRFDAGLDFEGTRCTLARGRTRSAACRARATPATSSAAPSPNPTKRCYRSHDRLHQPHRAVRRAHLRALPAAAHDHAAAPPRDL